MAKQGNYRITVQISDNGKLVIRTKSLNKLACLRLIKLHIRRGHTVVIEWSSEDKCYIILLN